jgi:SNF2 family DNA or RNA helicase
MELKGNFKVITTGTPVENHLGELWNLFRFINPGLLGSLESFNQRFAFPIEKYGDKQARNDLKKLIQPFLLRRTKAQVLQELPPRTEITLQVELNPEEVALYEALRRDAILKLADAEGTGGQKHLQILVEIMKLRRACCNPRLVLPDADIGSSKLQVLGEILQEMQENRHKALIFSQFVDHLQIVKEFLEQEKIIYQYLDGSTPALERKKRVDAFQSGLGDVFLISLKAGGTGLNLTAADYVIHLDPWWNPAVEDQASDRAHRMGQQRPVTIYRLVAKGTIEEKILELHNHKRDLADSLLDGSDVSGKLSAEELLKLITH